MTPVAAWRRRFPALAAAALGALALAAPAHAAVTIGSDLSAPFDEPLDCYGTCTLWQPDRSTGTAASPIDGVVVRWRVRSDAAGAAPVLRVIRKLPDGTIGAVSRSSGATLAAGVNTYEARVPISRDDTIGMDVDGRAGTFGTSAGEVLIWRPPLTTALSADPDFYTDGELLLNADVEPDGDADGFGDETQDRCPGAGDKAPGCARISLSATPAVPSVELGSQVVFRVTARNDGTVSAAGLQLDISNGRLASYSPGCNGTSSVSCGRVRVVPNRPVETFYTLRAERPGELLLQAAMGAARAVASVEVRDTVAPKLTLGRSLLRASRLGAVAVSVRCPATEPLGCKGVLTIRSGRTNLGQRSFTLVGGKTSIVRLRLARKGLVLLRRKRTLRVALITRASDTSGNVAKSSTRRKLYTSRR